MKIKQLKWSLPEYSGIFDRLLTEMGGLEYSILFTGDSAAVYFQGIMFGMFKGPTAIKDAKAAAQADFEQQVKACFETDDKSNFWG